MNFLTSFFSKDDAVVDSIIVCGSVALLVMIGLSVYATFIKPDSWNPITFATGAATTIATIAGGKTARDRWSAPPAVPTGDNDAGPSK